MRSATCWTLDLLRWIPRQTITALVSGFMKRCRNNLPGHAQVCPIGRAIVVHTITVHNIGLMTLLM
jgi:hypothetical protein